MTSLDFERVYSFTDNHSYDSFGEPLRHDFEGKLNHIFLLTMLDDLGNNIFQRKYGPFDMYDDYGETIRYDVEPKLQHINGKTNNTASIKVSLSK